MKSNPNIVWQVYNTFIHVLFCFWLLVPTFKTRSNRPTAELSRWFALLIVLWLGLPVARSFFGHDCNCFCSKKQVYNSLHMFLFFSCWGITYNTTFQFSSMSRGSKICNNTCFKVINMLILLSSHRACSWIICTNCTL